MDLRAIKVNAERSPRFRAWVIQCHIAGTLTLARRAATAGRRQDQKPPDGKTGAQILGGM